jgi:hypothetical protein|nr:MAG TPA: hypothetical protein [Bacteriophage sp.]
MAIQMSMDLYVLVVKNLKPNEYNKIPVPDQNSNFVRHNLHFDERVKTAGLVHHHGNAYVIYLVDHDTTNPDYLSISDFVFETKMELNTRYSPVLSIERDLKLIRSKETRSGFNLSEYFNGEITNDMSHHDLFNGIINFLAIKNDEITGSFLRDFIDRSNNYLNKLTQS